jgi:hypothetical protein
MSHLWLSLEPKRNLLHLSLSRGLWGLQLRGRLPLPAAQPGAMKLLLEALVEWHGQPLCAVLDADAEDVRRRPEVWTKLLDFRDPRFRTEWVTLPGRRQRDRFLTELGRERRAKRLINFASSGQR